MKKVTKDTIQLIKKSIDIKEHISRTVSLTPSGEFFVGKSPFAEDAEEGSLLILPQVQRFRCKITGKKGDVIDFESKLKQTAFLKSLMALALEYQIPIEYMDEAREKAVAA